MKRIADSFIKGVLHIAMVALMAMLIVELGNIIGRPLGVPVQGSVELTSYLGGILLSICVFYATFRRAKVAVRLITLKITGRSRAILDAGVALVGIITIFLVVWAGGKYAWNMMREGEFSQIYNFNLAYIRYVFVFSLLLFAVVLALDFCHAVTKEVKK